jgi:ubiquinone/menaquinone biosynthesis C-methylase UbiE
MSSSVNTTSDRFSGFAETYDAYRPQPPSDLLDAVLSLAKCRTPELVVDLGAGTGRSTRPWASRATQVIGIEPSDDMLREAVKATSEDNVMYRSGFGHATGLPDCCADIVTCASALHWMDPQPTLTEIARILRLGGVLAVYGYQPPPVTPFWRLDQAYCRVREQVDFMEKRARDRQRRDNSSGSSLSQSALPDSFLTRYKWGDLATTLKTSNHFEFVRQAAFHDVLRWNSSDYMGWLHTHAGIQFLLGTGITPADIGLDDLKILAQNTLGATRTSCFLSFSSWIAIRRE